MHLCAAKCCDDKNASMDTVHGCIERCSAPVTRAQNYIQKEIGEYQGRLQRCVMVSEIQTIGVFYLFSIKFYLKNKNIIF